jgi:hypothetical protein
MCSIYRTKQKRKLPLVLLDHLVYQVHVEVPKQVPLTVRGSYQAIVLPPSLNIIHFDSSKYTIFILHLHIYTTIYLDIHINSYAF